MAAQDKIPIRETIKQHDRYQFEMRFDYALEGKRRKFDLRSKHMYHMDAYFFIPKQMGISAETYKKSHFYEDIRPLIRFKEPQFAYRELMNSHEHKESPLVRLEEIFSNLASDANPEGRIELASEAIDLFKYFANAYVSNFRRKVHRRCKAIKELAENPGFGDNDLLAKMLVDLDPFLRRHFYLLKRFANLRTRYSLPEELRKDLISESLETEEYCYYRFRESIAQIVQTVNELRIIEIPELLTAKRKLHAWARFIHWFEYKRNFMHVSEHSSPFERERFLSHLGTLKKYLSRILYLELKTNWFFALQSQIGYMVAAGLAAFWYFFANLWIISYLQGANANGGFRNALGIGGFTVIFAFIAAYILKDRIKEIGRVRFQSGVWGKMPDHTHNVFYTNTFGVQTSVGKVQESVEFLRNLDSVPQEIQDIRERDEHEKEERFNILFYRRTLELDPLALRRLNLKFTSIKDIIRFSIRRYLTKLDDPVQIYLGLDRTGKVQEIGMPKVYYVGAAVKFFSKMNSSSGFDYQVLVVDKNGLVRIDEVQRSTRIED